MALISDNKIDLKSGSTLPASDVVCQWKEDDVLCWLREVNLSECVEAFKSRKIDGEELLTLNEEKLWLWAGDLKIRHRIQITKYLKDCRSKENTGPRKNATPQPPPVPPQDYTADVGDDEELSSYEWDTDFEDEPEDDRSENVENGVCTESQQTVSQVNIKNGFCNGKPGLVTERIQQLNASSPRTLKVKPEIPKRNHIPRPPSTLSSHSVNVSKSPSNTNRPYQLPPLPPTASKPIINFGNQLSAPNQRSNSEIESPSADDCLCDNYLIPTSSYTSENGIGSLASQIASSTVSLLSADSCSLDIEDSLSPSQAELNRVFLDEEDYEIPDIESQCSGSSGRSERSSSSDRPVLPPKADVNIPPPLPEKPNRRFNEPPMLPARPTNKKPMDTKMKTRHKSSLDECKQKISSILTTFSTKSTMDKKGDSTSTGNKLSPEREFIPTIMAAVAMTKSSSTPSLRPNIDGTALFSTMDNRPLPPVPGRSLSANEASPRIGKSPSVGNYLETFPWFHKVERDEAESLLKIAAKNESYLVRESRRAGESNPFTLSLFNEGKISHLNIRRRHDGKFALGKEKENEKTFNSVNELILYHQKEPIHITAQGQSLGKVSLLHPTEQRFRMQ